MAAPAQAPAVPTLAALWSDAVSTGHQLAGALADARGRFEDGRDDWSARLAAAHKALNALPDVLVALECALMGAEE